MPLISVTEIEALTSSSLINDRVILSRGEFRQSFTLLEPKNHGMAGVVWYAVDDLGEPCALKIIPDDQYLDHSILDEITEAKKLQSTQFARILAFGNIQLSSVGSSRNYYSVVTEWIEDSQGLDSFCADEPLTVEDFTNIASQLFVALSALRKKHLSHDDLHPGNVLVTKVYDDFKGVNALQLKVIDTGTIKRQSTRQKLLSELRNKIKLLEQAGDSTGQVEKCKELLKWKEPDDHLRVIENLLHAANALGRNYYRLDFWERKFFDKLPEFFSKVTDPQHERRLDDPRIAFSELETLANSCRYESANYVSNLSSPFDFISAEMIRSDRQFYDLFSQEFPWLMNCQSLEPLYIYGPRGCGKSSVLRFLSFKTQVANLEAKDVDSLKEIGVYVSCSVELRSRFWLLTDSTIESLQEEVVLYFNLLLLEELFDTLSVMYHKQTNQDHPFNFTEGKMWEFATWFMERIGIAQRLYLQGQECFQYLRNFVRKTKWETWSAIQRNEPKGKLPDFALALDTCKVLPSFFPFFKNKHITFLVDDYSKQRIPEHLQKKLNQTISFAKLGNPIFKVSSEYNGVDLDGIQEGREVVEVNIGCNYTELNTNGHVFIADILNRRLKKAEYIGAVETLLGRSTYDNMPAALAAETKTSPFYYHGIDCIHWICSGDVALAIDLTRRIFEAASIVKASKQLIEPHVQHDIIQQFSHDETKRIKYILPDGEQIFDIVCNLGWLARSFVMGKTTKRKDRPGNPVCKTHLDIRIELLRQLELQYPALYQVYQMITSRAILFSLDTSRSRLQGTTERLQIRRIYLPAFKAPLKRDVPIKIDNLEELKSLLTNPKTFAQRELKKSGIGEDQLELAISGSVIKPKD